MTTRATGRLWPKENSTIDAVLEEQTDRDAFQREIGIFEEVCQLPREQRNEFLDSACEDDLHLRERVEALLRQHDDAGTAPAASTWPQTIDRYDILEEIGRGGMGVVYRARQTEPIERIVAVKVIQPGFADPQLVAHFETERQALAVLRHPNIARFLDAGAMSDGRPFFVMEHIPCRPITTHCDEERPSTVDRLRILLQVFTGVQHAHERGSTRTSPDDEPDPLRTGFRGETERAVVGHGIEGRQASRWQLTLLRLVDPDFRGEVKTANRREEDDRNGEPGEKASSCDGSCVSSGDNSQQYTRRPSGPDSGTFYFLSSTGWRMFTISGKHRFLAKTLPRRRSGSDAMSFLDTIDFAHVLSCALREDDEMSPRNTRDAHGEAHSEEATPWRWRNWILLNATVFVAAACIMTVEILSTRLVARYLGSSLYTWTSAIGVVLAGISLGNYIGGRLADRFHPRRTLALLFVLASVACATIPIVNKSIGTWSALDEISWPAHTFLHFVMTFLLPATTLGTMSPVVAKMALVMGRRTGRTIGTIYAWGSIGSIVGTFVAGFFLVSWMGTERAIVLISGILAVVGVLYGYRSWSLPVLHWLPWVNVTGTSDPADPSC